MDGLKKIVVLILAVLFALGMVGLLLYVYYFVEDFRVSLAIAAVFGAGLLIFQRKNKKKSKY